jgi:hypothetical protein
MREILIFKNERESAMWHFDLHFNNIIDFIKAYHGALARDGKIDYTP